MCANMGNFEFSDLNLGKLPNYVWILFSNNVEGVAESWLEAEMSWVEVSAWFSNSHFFNLKKKIFCSQAKYLDFDAFMKFTCYKICDVITGVTSSGILTYVYFFWILSILKKSLVKY